MSEETDGIVIQSKSPLSELLEDKDIAAALVKFGHTLTDVKKALMMSELTDEEIQIFAIHLTRAKHYPDALGHEKDFIVYKLLLKISHGRKGRSKIETILENAFGGINSRKDDLLRQLKGK